MSRTILHCDMNNFYASVECFLDPKLKPFPVAVCGDVEERHGIVLAKNYKAKGYGVSTGEAIWQAKQKCPGLVVVPPHYEEYMKFSKAAREIYEHYTDQVEPFGMDECWLDVTGSTRIMGNGEKIANEIRERIWICSFSVKYMMTCPQKMKPCCFRNRLEYPQNPHPASPSEQETSEMTRNLSSLSRRISQLVSLPVIRLFAEPAD